MTAPAKSPSTRRENVYQKAFRAILIPAGHIRMILRWSWRTKPCSWADIIDESIGETEKECGYSYGSLARSREGAGGEGIMHHVRYFRESLF